MRIVSILSTAVAAVVCLVWVSASAPAGPVVPLVRVSHAAFVGHAEPALAVEPTG